MSSPLPGKGQQIYVEIASVLTKVSNVVSITPAQSSQEVYEYTELEDSSVRRRGTGQADGGDGVQIQCNYDPESATHQFLIAQSKLEASVAFRETDPQSNNTDYNAVVTSAEKDEITAGQNQIITFTLAVDGAVTHPTP